MYDHVSELALTLVFAKGEDVFSNRKSPVTFDHEGSHPPVPLIEKEDGVHSLGVSTSVHAEDMAEVGEYRTTIAQLAHAATSTQPFDVIEKGAETAPVVTVSFLDPFAQEFCTFSVFSIGEFAATVQNANAVAGFSITFMIAGESPPAPFGTSARHPSTSMVFAAAPGTPTATSPDTLPGNQAFDQVIVSGKFPTTTAVFVAGTTAATWNQFSIRLPRVTSSAHMAAELASKAAFAGVHGNRMRSEALILNFSGFSLRSGYFGFPAV